MSNDKLKNIAIDLIEVYLERSKKYESINSDLKDIQGDFPQRLNVIDDELLSKLLKLLDQALDNDDTASYFIFECQNMKGGGSVQLNGGKTYPLKTIQDLKDYIFRDK